MALDLDLPPIYDPLTKVTKDSINDIWLLWITSFVQSLIEYVGHYGMLMPQLTTTQRNEIQAPVEGQFIYNMTLLQPQIWRNGQWRTFTTTP